jgi:hypothetical protein
MAWPRLEGMAELCRWQVWPYSIQRAGQNADDIKMSLSEDFGYRQTPERYVICEYGNVWPRRKKKVRQTNFLLWAPWGLSSPRISVPEILKAGFSWVLSGD